MLDRQQAASTSPHLSGKSRLAHGHGACGLRLRALGLYDAGQTPRPVDLHHGEERLLEAPPPPDERRAGVVPPARREAPQRLGHGVVVHVDLVRVRVRV